MKDLKEELKEGEILLLKTGMDDNANLLNEDELGEIFAGYRIHCDENYTPPSCGCGYDYVS